MLLGVLLALQSDSSTRSFLKTVDVPSGRIATVYSADRHFEAPNWSRDGYFIVNSQGRLYRLSARDPYGPCDFRTPNPSPMTVW